MSRGVSGLREGGACDRDTQRTKQSKAGATIGSRPGQSPVTYKWGSRVNNESITVEFHTQFSHK